MARIRSIHPGLFTDEAFVQLSCDAQMLLIGLWTEADDQGVFEWKPLTLRMRLRPTKDGPVDPLLEEMTALNIIRKYEVEGRQLGAIRNFRKFQKPKFPNATHLITNEIRNYVGLSGVITEIYAVEEDAFPRNGEIDSDELKPFPPNGENASLMERRGVGEDKKESLSHSRKSKKPDLPGFDEFCRIYPKKRFGNREKAKLAYQNAVQRGFTEAEITTGAAAYAESREVAEGFAKGAAAWLNDDRFTNDYSEMCNGKNFRRGNAAPTKTDRLRAVLDDAIANPPDLSFWGRPGAANRDDRVLLPGPGPVRQGTRTDGGGDTDISHGSGEL